MDKMILGFTEHITIISKNQKEISVIARIDTGATSSSIDIKLAEELELGPSMKSKIVKSASGTKERPLVEATIRMNNLIIKEYFTLADRSHMTYPVLIGQNILKQGNYLIDPHKK